MFGAVIAKWLIVLIIIVVVVGIPVWLAFPHQPVRARTRNGTMAERVTAVPGQQARVPDMARPTQALF